MDNHPIPQDVTGFQFKLIGEMTVKQFAYLATGVVSAWLFYTVLSVSFLLKAPLCVLLAGFGAALAFLPVEGRPFDTMLINFVKAIFANNQYIFQKQGSSVDFSFLFSAPQLATSKGASLQSPDKLSALLKTLSPKPKNALDQKELVYFTSLGTMFLGTANQKQQSTPKTLPQTPVVTKQPKTEEEQIEKEKARQEEALTKQTAILKEELAKAKQIEQAQESVTADSAHQKVATLTQELQNTLLQKQQLEKELMLMQQKLSSQGQSVFTPSLSEQRAQTPHVRVVPKDQGATVGTPFTDDIPNLITGIVKDARGNGLPHILIEVKDKDGNPVRALKTTMLGQFTSATPLANGDYTVTFEDPKNEHKFDVIALSATGGALLPIEAISVDAREELRRSLFNT